MNIKKKNTFPFDLEIILGEERGKYIDFSIPIYQVFKGWDRLLPYLREGNYFVVFESRRKRFPFLDELLNFADYFAYREAKKMPGFMGYYRGELDAQTHVCRSFCVWDKRESARKSARKPNHRRAMLLTKIAFDVYKVKRYLVKRKGSEISYVEYIPERTG
ncbi:MAG TPA: hypothetical protein VN711_04380 [Candidatus Saccharimonadales bacterium]|nr:hypothetical protein [Candidatus Saccharimonadales bacterium]